MLWIRCVRCAALLYGMRLRLQLTATKSFNVVVSVCPHPGTVCTLYSTLVTVFRLTLLGQRQTVKADTPHAECFRHKAFVHIL